MRRLFSHWTAPALGLLVVAACGSGAAPAAPAPAAKPPAATASPQQPAAQAPSAPAASGPQAAVNLDIGIISGAGYYIAGYLATDRGFLEQEGIKGEWVVAGTPESIRAVVSGSVPVGLLGSDP